MLDDERQKVTAELCGWRKIEVGARASMWRYSGPRGTILLSDMSTPPNYCYDLGVMLEARKEVITTPQQRVDYLTHLLKIVGRRLPTNKVGTPIVSSYDLINAEAIEHNEAFLKTFGKWVE